MIIVLIGKQWKNMNKNKSFIILVLGVIIVSIFVYKAYSTNLQKDKEQAVIQTQLLKEKEILEQKQIYELEKEQNQKRLQDICLSQAADNAREKLDFFGFPPDKFVEKCIEEGNFIIRARENCISVGNDLIQDLNDDFEKEEAECYQRYPLK